MAHDPIAIAGIDTCEQSFRAAFGARSAGSCRKVADVGAALWEWVKTGAFCAPSERKLNAHEEFKRLSRAKNGRVY